MGGQIQIFRKNATTNFEGLLNKISLLSQQNVLDVLSFLGVSYNLEVVHRLYI